MQIVRENHALQSDRPNATIAVFGANGFIGRAIVSRLIRDQRRVVAVGRNFPPNFSNLVGGDVEIRLVDFTDALAVNAALYGVDQAIDLVNSSSPALGNGQLVEDTIANVLPHIGFIQSCIAHGVSRIVFVSSGGTVYGSAKYLPIDENHPTEPLVSYGVSKLMVEHYVRMLTRGTAVDYAILRVSNPFGPGQVLRKGQGLIPSILARHEQGLPIVVYGDGTMLRDYLYIDDLTDALVRALDTLAVRDTFNIGTGIGRSILEVICEIEGQLDQQISVEFVADRSTDAKDNVLNCRKAGDMLQWTARTSFADGLFNTMSSLRASDNR